MHFAGPGSHLEEMHKVLLGDNESGSGMGGALPVFVFVLTKMARVEGGAPMKVCNNYYTEKLG